MTFDKICLPVLVLLFSVLLNSAAHSAGTFEEWVQSYKLQAAKQGISAATLESALSDVEYLSWIIEVDRRQPEFKKTLAEYLAGAVSEWRIKQGKRLLDENRALFEKIAQKYQVQPRFLVALWGIETSYGRNTGKVPILSALATLAYDARRSSYFRQELLYALQILDSGRLTKTQFVGSWAGAMGQLQFMPSTFLSYAIDGNGDGRIDLWKSREDYLSSAANYLHSIGWQGNRTWGRAVRIPESFKSMQIGLDHSLPLPAWQKAGVRLKNGRNLPNVKLSASLILPEESGEEAFLVYENYRALMKWNRAHSFAIAVGLLADRLVMD